MKLRMYYIKNGKRSKAFANGFESDVKEYMRDVGLDTLRRSAGADKNSPIMVIVK